MASRTRIDEDDYGNDKMPTRYGGVGRFADSATSDAAASTVNELDAWDSDEDMEQLAALDCDFRYSIGYRPGLFDCPNAPWFER